MTRIETGLGLVRDKLEIHPAADIFPMMSDEELQDLAASIVENGQLQPIVIRDGLLIDGRNRLAACKLANVNPVFTTLPDDKDPLAYIDAMDTRRNVSKGQRAMATAMRYPDGQQGRGKNAAARKASVSNGFSRQRLKDARSVLHHSRSLAESVVKGITPLDTALATVRQEQQYQNSDEAKLARLQQSAPDLAEQVNEERLKINEAIAALTEREQQMRHLCERGRRAASEIVGHFVGAVLAIEAAAEAGERLLIPAELREQLRESQQIFWKRQEREEKQNERHPGGRGVKSLRKPPRTAGQLSRKKSQVLEVFEDGHFLGGCTRCALESQRGKTSSLRSSESQSRAAPSRL